MAGADSNGSRLKELEQREELIQVEKKGEELQAWEEARKKRKEEALKIPDKQTEPIRASAAASSSPPCQPPPPATHIHQLPDDVLEGIFRLLSLQTIVKVLSVCRRWRSVIQDYNLIEKLKFEDGSFTTEEAVCLIRSSPGLKTLELVRRNDAEALLDAASTGCTNLVQLSIWSCIDSVEDWPGVCSEEMSRAFIKVSQASPHVSVSCEMCKGSSRELGRVLPDVDVLYELETHGHLDTSPRRHQIEKFKALTNSCTAEHVPKLVQFWGRSLRVLELSTSIFADGAFALLAGCSELRRLTLRVCTTLCRVDWLCDLAALPHLEELVLSGRMQLQELCRFFSQSRSSQGLRKLSLQGYQGLDDRVLASIASFCVQLEELEVFYRFVSISGVREVLRCCTKLQELNVYNTDASVAQVVAELPQLAPQLRRFCIGDQAMHSLDKATLRRVQEQMPRLRIE